MLIVLLEVKLNYHLLMDKLKLWDHVEFVGYLSEEQVQAQLRRTHVFVSPSSMENQSTALGQRRQRAGGQRQAASI